MVLNTPAIWILVLSGFMGCSSADLVLEEKYSLFQDGGRDMCKCVESLSRTLLCKSPSSCDTLSFTELERTVLTLEIRSTSLVTLRAEDFLGFSALEAMSVENNYLLVDIEAGVFSQMNNLKNLSISSNVNLSYLSKDVFNGLSSLSLLQLKKNNFTTLGDFVPALSPKYLPLLKILILNENSLQRIESDGLAPLEGSNLESLYLVSCEIEYLHPKSLSPLKNLKNLHLGQNPIDDSSLTKLIYQMALDNLYLTSLNIYSIGLNGHIPTDLLKAVSSSNVTHLSLAGNQMHSLKPGSFPVMPKLIYLDLREIVAINFPENVLNETVVPNLQVLLLGGNKLPGVIPGVLVPQLTSLDLSSNSGYNNVFFEVGEERFTHMIKLGHLNLSYNNIREITPRTFKGLTNLDRMLSLKNSSISTLQSASFKDLTSLKFLNLEDNLFPMFMDVTSEMFEGLKSLRVLLLGGCRIKYLDPNAFIHLPSLEFIGLDRNMLVTLEPSLFVPLSYLIGLDLTSNRLISWEDESGVLFSNNSRLEAVFLRTNQITHVSPAMFESFAQLGHVDLSDNPLICECVYYNSARAWMESRNFSSDVLRGECQNVGEFHGWSLEDYLNSTVLNTICMLPTDADNSIVTWVGVSFTAIIVLILVSVFVAYKYRSYIRYWTYLMNENARQNTTKKKNGEFQSYSNYQYDAFVSYSNADRNFVVRLVAMLENYEPFLKLCVYERDFEIGSMISESILQSVAMSRKIVLVITDSFVKSQWCMWELQLVGNHGIFSNHKRCSNIEDFLVIVKLGSVCDANLTPLLRYLLRTHVYLEWDPEPRKQRIFWDKLRSSLTPPAVTITSPAPARS